MMGLESNSLLELTWKSIAQSLNRFHKLCILSKEREFFTRHHSGVRDFRRKYSGLPTTHCGNDAQEIQRICVDFVSIPGAHGLRHILVHITWDVLRRLMTHVFRRWKYRSGQKQYQAHDAEEFVGRENHGKFVLPCCEVASMLARHGEHGEPTSRLIIPRF